MSNETVICLGILLGGLGAGVGMQMLIAAMRSKRLIAMMERLYRGDMSALKAFHYLDVNPRALCFPFKAGESEQIARCCAVSRRDITVTPIHIGHRFWDSYYFQVTYDFQGKDGHASPVEIKRTRYLYIQCRNRSSFFTPVICHVEWSKEDF